MKSPILAALAVALVIPTAAQSARPMVAAGHAFSVALHTNGTVYHWGNWYCSSVTNTGLPELIPGLTGITAIAAGNNHLLALKSDGTVLAMGSNSDGQLGNGVNFTNSCTPSAVSGLTGVIAIAASSFTSYALLSNNTIRSWGDSLFGALGASGNDRTAPGAATTLTGVTAIASGGDSSFALAIKSPGSVAAWGDNLRYQLGFTTFGSSTSTAGFSGGLTAARRIAAGNYSSVASRNDGSVFTWGWNINGELGAGTTGGNDRLTPSSVGGVTGVLELASGQNHILAVRYDGTVYTWGDGTFGQLGDNGSAPRGTPALVSGLTNAVQAAGGYAHSTVLASDGSVWGFGVGFDGAVGDNTFTTRRLPVKVLGPGGAGFLNLGVLAPIVPATDTDGDGIPDILEAGESRNAGVKDNDIFGNARLFAMQQYRDFLNREGDAGGIASWTNFVGTGGARGDVVGGFFSSAEFQGTISPVARLYFAYFLRIPDYGGLQFWINYYRAGNPLSAVSDAFAGSAEFTSRYGALANDQFVDLVYQNVLGRAADAGGKSYWLGQLNGGMSRGQMMIGFSESAEYVASIGSEVTVTMTYVGMLRRAPDQSGFNFWVGYLDQGNSGRALIDGFLAAQEYHLRFLP